MLGKLFFLLFLFGFCYCCGFTSESSGFSLFLIIIILILKYPSDHAEVIIRKNANLSTSSMGYTWRLQHRVTVACCVCHFELCQKGEWTL